MDTLLRQRALTKVIQAFSLSIEETPETEWTAGLVQVRQELLTDYWNNFQVNHLVLLEEPAPEPEQSAEDDMLSYAIIEKMYITAQAVLYNIQMKLDADAAKAYEAAEARNITPRDRNTEPTARNVAPSNAASSIRLPRITIPVFTGLRSDWESFRDLFRALIHNDESLTDVERLYYLKAHVDGKAKAALEKLQIIGTNYTTAWSLLESRYQHRRLLVEDHLTALLKLKPLSKETATELQSLLDSLEGHRDQLRALKRPVDTWDDWFVTIASNVMDSSTRRTWEDEMEKLGRSEDGQTEVMATFANLTDFLRKRCRALNSVEGSQFPINVTAPSKPDSTANSASSGSNRSQRSGNARSLATHFATSTCALCNENHYIGHCNQYLQLEVNSRRNTINRSKLCFNCLRPGHVAKACPSRSTCQVCQALHHSTLHEGGRRRDGESISDGPSSPKQRHVDETKVTTASTLTSEIKTESLVLLPTAVLKISSGRGRILKIRAMLDSCSEVTLIGVKLARLLNAILEDVNVNISGANGGFVDRAHKKIRLLIHAVGSESPVIIDAHCIRHLGLSTPAIHVSQSIISNWNDLDLADPSFGIPAPVDLLIGSNALPELMLSGFIRRSDLIAQRTTVGWIISGRATTTLTSSNAISCPTLQADSPTPLHDELLQSVQRFWEVEEVPKANRISPLDEACEQIFARHSRTRDGRYIVRLPLKPDASLLLGESFTSALAALNSLHRRMERDPVFAQEYRKFMAEYIDLGHMRLVTENPITECSQTIHYIPHHGIWQKSDRNKKLRVVFNASRPTSTGLSLNDVLYIGPKLQTDLWRVIVSWRRHKIAFCADIKMMFRQIEIDSHDIDLQRILWSPNAHEPVAQYQLSTVTYGEACAPYLSLRVLQQLCKDEGADWPLAAEAVLKERYVDDILSGSNNLESALELRDQIIGLLNAGGFPLRKWVSNNPELLQDLPPENCLRPSWIRLATDGPVTELGITWDVEQDAFRILPPSLKESQHTKREILAAIASMFDPCGWLAPIILQAKILLQDLWRARLEWDEPLPPSMAIRWSRFKEELQFVSNISLPRWIHTGLSRNVQLHAFSDASRRAMAAVVFVRVTDEEGSTSVSLLAAKTKLNSIKSLKPTETVLPRMTIPRLELRAVLLACRLLGAISSTLNIPSNSCYIWCDAQIVLRWLQSLEPVGHALIDNYICHIQELQPEVTWRYVPTDTNPADVATRGASPSVIATHPLWLTGPAWLSDPPSNWPSTVCVESTTEPTTFVTAATTVRQENLKRMKPDFDLFAVFSNLDVLLRFMVRLRRWIRFRLNREKSSRALDPITAAERNEAFKACVRLSQSRHFKEELKNVRDQKPASVEPRVRQLDLFICPEKILRVGGRLHHSDLSLDERHPPLLSDKCRLAELVLAWAHCRSVHGGFRLTYAFAMRRAWILGGRRRVRCYLYKCVVCSRAQAKPLEQKMASLPPERVTVPTRAFARTGIDYAGPFQVLAAKGRGIRTTKAYVSLFVCLNTKALHLELVGDMTTESFLGALTRFAGRRGRPAQIWSDNATTFRRADADLRIAFQDSSISWDQVAEKLAENGIEWKYIPPPAPHFGGLWEAGVKLVKTHLKRILSPRNLTFEEFSTLLVSIESVLNSRPLTPLSGEIDDLEALTAGHLLIGGPLDTIPDAGPSPSKIDHLTHWKLVRGLRDRFWDQWSREYLNTLQQRHKWPRARTNLQEGNLVVIIDASLIRPNGQWPLGRVISTSCGRDGLVRSATVKTANGVYVRPIVKLSKLPINAPEEDITSISDKTKTLN